MSDRCSRCGSTALVSVELNKSLLVSPDPNSAPNIFPFQITYCSFCGYVPRDLPHDGYFTYKNDFNRANDAREVHYHKTGWHFEFVTKGSFDYYQRPIGSKIKPVPVTVTVGQLYFIPPMVEHGLVFKEITSVLSLVNTGRPEGDLVTVQDDFLGTHNPGPAHYRHSRKSDTPGTPSIHNGPPLTPLQIQLERIKKGKL